MKQYLSYLVFVLVCGLMTACVQKTASDASFGENPLHTFTVKLDEPGRPVWNVSDNVNIWSYSPWSQKKEEGPDDFFRKQLPFIRYIQVMTAAGGNLERDLFKDPTDRSVTDDYNFEPLVRACENFMQKGLIPHLKLGNVPMKYSIDPVKGRDFDVNLLPPYDYNLWHSYIKAMIQSLSDAFGVETVRAWRFGFITEYENRDWFTIGDDSEKTRDACIKLYDYTVDAVQQVLGENICIGAHSMTVGEGLWDERELIAHCGSGTNYCTGKTGTRLSFLASSYYDWCPGRFEENKLPQVINHLRDAAVQAGFDNLFYGVDEGRLLFGLDEKDLASRDVGYTWQAAYDARIYRIMLDNDVDYFSRWAYTAKGLSEGIDAITAHSARLFYRLNGALLLPVQLALPNDKPGEETGLVAALDKEKNKLYLYFYAYSDSVFKQEKRDIQCEIAGFGSKAKTLKATRSLVSDDTNFFDEWTADWKAMGLTDDDFGWSRESFLVMQPTVLDTLNVNKFYDKEDYYRLCAELHPTTEKLTIEDGVLTLRTTIPDHGVLLYEIDLGRQ